MDSKMNKNKLHNTITFNPAKLARQQLFLDNFDVFLSIARSQYLEHSSLARFKNKHQTYLKCETYYSVTTTSVSKSVSQSQISFNFLPSQLQFVFGSNVNNKERRKEL
jgi:hypothetical protein